MIEKLQREAQENLELFSDACDEILGEKVMLSSRLIVRHSQPSGQSLNLWSNLVVQRSLGCWIGC